MTVRAAHYSANLSHLVGELPGRVGSQPAARPGFGRDGFV